MNKINVLIPMAGDGKRFADAGYAKPKPFIQVKNKKMIEIVVDNITPRDVNKIILVTRSHHNCKEELKNSYYNFNIIELDKPTDGSLQTILCAEEFIKNDKLILANCDQKIIFDVNDFIRKCENLDGGLITFKSNNKHHSYVTVDENNLITSIIEKEVISNIAVAGVYYFKKGEDFVEASKKVIQNNIRQKGEFYVSSALSLMINQGLKLGIYNAESIMLGTPEELTKNIELI
jgi:dTDP-glucose pyrophosphorylase